MEQLSINVTDDIINVTIANVTQTVSVTVPQAQPIIITMSDSVGPVGPPGKIIESKAFEILPDYVNDSTWDPNNLGYNVRQLTDHTVEYRNISYQVRMQLPNLPDIIIPEDEVIFSLSTYASGLPLIVLSDIPIIGVTNWQGPGPGGSFPSYTEVLAALIILRIPSVGVYVEDGNFKYVYYAADEFPGGLVKADFKYQHVPGNGNCCWFADPKGLYMNRTNNGSIIIDGGNA
jgi:hypothetical protein